MPKKNLLLILFCSLLFSATYATETEPNNSAATANTVALNGSDNGAISPTGDVDWWKVTTNKDGKITITWTSTNGVNVSCYLYDNDGTTQLGYNNSTGTTSLSVDGLAAGTYYFRMQCFYGTESGAYTFSNTLTLPPVPVDAEPNGTQAQALTMPLNSSVNGHINYYYNNQKDTYDWYKVTTNADGRLRLTMQSLNGQNVSWYMYANDGTTAISGGYGNTTSTGATNVDGMAAGTYYVRVQSFYSNEFSPYTFSDSLFPPTILNDVEPNGTKAQAKVIPLNNSRSGHIGYKDFYAIRDTFDWYKVTTIADGRLQLNMQSFNGQNVSWYLYDNDGTTQLSYGNTTSTGLTNKDGLAAGTYYIRVNTYYSNEFSTYTLKDSLFSPTQANDAEPNDTKEQALTFAPNSTVTGHTGYYYNLVRDAFDWYKITLPADGNLQLTIASNNGQNVSCYLYDNNGITQLNYINTTSSATINTDGLQAGTYYVRIKNYYSSEWAPYTLTNALQTYTYTVDAEPNDAAYQARTIPANGTVTGHVGFTYNGSRDAIDWYKINYTGSGALTLNINQEAHKSNGAFQNLSVYVYKDTAASYIGYQNTTAASWSLSLAGLTSGYYWVRVQTYYGNEFAAYSINDVFTQVTKAAIKVVLADTATTCGSNTNSITFKCTKSLPPYTVQLYRYGVAYGSPLTITNTKNFQIKNLPQGSYQATAFADGATGTAFGKSATIGMLPPVTGTLATTNVAQTGARANWTTTTCAKFYVVQYHKAGDSAWLTKTSAGNVGFTNLTGLTANTTYRWRVQAADSVGKVVALSKPTDSTSFSTLTAAFAINSSDESSIASDKLNNAIISAMPNPAQSQVRIQVGNKINEMVNATMKDVNGSVVWSKLNVHSTALNNQTINVTSMPNGIYMLQVIGTNNKPVATQKIIVAH